MKRRDKRKRRKKRLAYRPAKAAMKPDMSGEGATVRVTRDSHGRMYIKAPDGSNRRADKVDPKKLAWLSDGEGC